ncbi:hypothetical protein Cni_G24579 [Canna indica]|uniref:Uncharacterized protein n=1 Tax=Canna indica TaxID=4628 RepID=A0AAQ3KVK4_9LILI|nr:hypothetical protein Cni_G24579 [Canna indica]
MIMKNMFPPEASFCRDRRPSLVRSNAARYIRLVQHLIEKCLTFHMERDDCVRVLAKHANIQPVITNAVWDGLLRENPGFFGSYFELLGRRRLMRAHRNAIWRHSMRSREWW